MHNSQFVVIEAEKPGHFTLFRVYPDGRTYSLGEGSKGAMIALRAIILGEEETRPSPMI